MFGCSVGGIADLAGMAVFAESVASAVVPIVADFCSCRVASPSLIFAGRKGSVEWSLGVWPRANGVPDSTD